MSEQTPVRFTTKRFRYNDNYVTVQVNVSGGLDTFSCVLSNETADAFESLIATAAARGKLVEALADMVRVFTDQATPEERRQAKTTALAALTAARPDKEEEGI